MPINPKHIADAYKAIKSYGKANSPMGTSLKKGITKQPAKALQGHLTRSAGKKASNPNRGVKARGAQKMAGGKGYKDSILPYAANKGKAEEPMILRLVKSTAKKNRNVRKKKAAKKKPKK